MVGVGLSPGRMTGATAGSSTRAPARWLFSASTGEVALQREHRSDIDLAVNDSLDGFSVVEEIRRKQFQGAICIHSNRSSAEDSQKGLDVGADLILPKPMSRAHLLGFIASALGKVEFAKSSVVLAASIKPVVIVVDDDSLVLLGWEMDIGSEVEITTFRHY